MIKHTQNQLTESTKRALNEAEIPDWYKWMAAWSAGSWFLPQTVLGLGMAIKKGKDLNKEKPSVYPAGSGRHTNPYSGPFPNKM